MYAPQGDCGVFFCLSVLFQNTGQPAMFLHGTGGLVVDVFISNLYDLRFGPVCSAAVFLTR